MKLFSMALATSLIAAMLVALCAGAAVPSSVPVSGAPTGEPPWPGIAEAVVDAESIRPVGLVRSAAGFLFETGHLSIRFDQGRVVALEDGLGPVGFFVLGRGTGQYVSADSSDRAVFPWNIQQMTRLKVKDDAVAFKLRRALVVATDGPGSFRLPEPPSMDEPPLPAIDPEVKTMVEECLSIAGWDFPILRAASRVNAGPPVVYTALSGKARLGHVHDGNAGMERLSVVRGETTGRRYEIASEQPAVPAGRGGTHAARGPAWIMTDLSLEASFRKSPELEIRASFELVPKRSPERIVLLSIDERREYLDVLPDAQIGSEIVGSVVRRSEPAIAVRSVSVGGKPPAGFAHRYDTLVVELTGPLEPRKPLKMDVTLDTKLARLPAQHEYWTLRAPGWFPVPRGQSSRFSLSWRITSRDPFRPIVPGEVTRNVVADEDLRVSTRLPYPVRNPILVAGRFIRTPGSGNGVPLNVWTYARAGRNAEAISRFCEGAVVFFSKVFGPYPFSRLDVVEAAQMTGGQSGPGIILVAGMDPLDLALARRRLGTSAFNMTFAHEVAHQWWGQLVSSPGPSEDWLYEALAEYSAWLFVRDLKGDFREQVPEDWLWRAKRSGRIAPLGGAHRIAGDGARRHKANIVYGKGALMLKAVAEVAGEAELVKALKAFAREHSGREAGFRELRAAITKSTGRDLSHTFREWMEGTGLPDNYVRGEPKEASKSR